MTPSWSSPNSGRNVLTLQQFVTITLRSIERTLPNRGSGGGQVNLQPTQPIEQAGERCIGRGGKTYIEG